MTGAVIVADVYAAILGTWRSAGPGGLTYLRG